MTVHACTIIARNYISASRVLAKSFLEHHPGGTFSVLLIDDILREVDDSAEIFEVLHLTDVGFSDQEIHRLAAIYNITEFSTSVKPWLLAHLIERWKSSVLYIDPDIVVFSDLEAIAEAADDHELVVTPHVLAPMPRDGKEVSEYVILGSGIYNLGFLAVGPRSGAFLDFWKERLARDCLSDPAKMRFVDQRWVDFAPGMFDTHILKSPRYNVAYWNLDGRDVTIENGRYMVAGEPLGFFHYSGFDPRTPTLLCKYIEGDARILLSERPVVAQLCDEYATALEEAGYFEERENPYGYRRLPTGVEYEETMRLAYRKALIDAEDEGKPLPPNPFDDPDGFVEWLNAVAPQRSLPRYADAYYISHTEISGAFPDVNGRDHRAVVQELQKEVDRGNFNPRFLPAHIPNVGEFHGYDAQGVLDLVPGIRVAGYLRAEMGVGQLGRLALAAVKASGVTSGTYVDTLTLARQQHAITEEVRDNLNVNLVCVNADALPSFAYRADPFFFKDRYTIGLWAWEIEEFPDQFDDAFRFVDEVWALSEFARKAIAPHTDKPVLTFTLPIEMPVRPTLLTRADLGLPDGPFFLFAFDLLSIMERKNPLGLIEAFRRAFAPGEGPTLVIKALSGEHRLADLEKLRMRAAREPDVVLIDEYLSRDENLALMELCDCYVSLHRSEGFGLTIAEAMSLGKPVIATAYSGNLDFMTEETSYFVPYTAGSVPKGCEPYPVGSYWAEPDLDAAARLMRYVLEHPDEAAATGERARRHIAEYHSPSTRAAFVQERFAAAQATLTARREFADAYFAPLVPSSPENRLPEVAPVPPLRDLSGLAGLAASGVPVDGPSRYGALARFIRRAVRRVLRNHDHHQRRINSELVAQIEALQSRVEDLTAERRTLIDGKSRLELANREYLEWINDLKTRVDFIGAFVSASDEKIADRFTQIDTLGHRISDHEHRLSALALKLHAIEKDNHDLRDLNKG